MSKCSAILVVSLLTASQYASAACNNEYDDRSVMLQDNDEFSLCLDIIEGINSFTDSILSVGGLIKDEPAANDYWSDWVLKNDADPLITQQVSQSYFGVGVWIPEELDEDNSLTTEQWLMSHGLQLSVGLGNKSPDTPRVRFDYRWHETHDGDVMMQVEVPF